MPNAAYNVTVDSTGYTIFQTARRTAEVAGQLGQDADGVLGITIYNSGANDALVKCADMHGDVTAWNHGSPMPTQWMLLPAGKSVTLEVEAGPLSKSQIDEVKVKAVSTSTTISWGVTKRR